MANKDLFKQAIAEAKSVREAAIANAKEALEETLTPHLKDMLAAKLQEMEDKEVDEAATNDVQEDVEEAKHHDKDMDEAHKDKDMDEAHKDKDMDEAHKDKDMDEAMKDDDMDEAHKDEKDEAMKPKKDEAMKHHDDTDEAMKHDDEKNEAEDDSEESEDEAEDHGAEDEADGDEELGDLTVDQFKDLIRDIISAEMGGGEPADMDAGDIEGMGDEENLELPDAPAEDEEEIDLDELLQELEAVSEADKDKEMEEAMKDKKDKMEAKHGKDKEAMEETSNQVNAEADGKDYNVNRVAKLEEDLKESVKTIETLKKDLNEVNILNSKLLYVNKIFKANNLTESQKVNVIAAFDKAETVKEVKLVFETVSENIVTKKETTIKEHKGMASKATGTTASKPEVISEVSDAVRRMQKLAGIIK